jgi:phosphatidylserine synthase
MKISDMKAGQLFGATWIAGPDKGQKSGWRISLICRVCDIFRVAATNVKTNEMHVFGFRGEDVPSNWILIEDAAPPQSNSK